MRILLIEDESVLRMTFKYLLEEEGYCVCEASNGREGLDIFSRTHPDLVITDMLMPELDGFETIKRIRAIAPDVPIIAMSAAFDERAMKRPMEDGPYCCVRKPIDKFVLFDIVKAIIEPEPSVAD